MNSLDAIVRDAAIKRIAEIFRVPADSLKSSMRFGVDLSASFVSDFRRNEFDQVSDDIRDVADKSINKELDSGRLVIQTIGDYCDHMARCAAINPSDVKKLLRLV